LLAVKPREAFTVSVCSTVASHHASLAAGRGIFVRCRIP
jgi:hypothetical protein